MNKKLMLLVLVFVLAGTFAVAQDAASIVERSRNRIQAETVSSRSRMIITARGGAVSELVLDQYSKKDAQGNKRAIIVFQGGVASVRGTRFLSIENPGRGNDQWIFSPSLGRVRRIAGSEGSSSFVGTDFSYDDIASMDRNAGLDTHRILREERFEGKDCYVIESTPKDSGYQYSKMIQWLEKDKFLIHKIELYDRRGSQVKLLEILEYREVQGRQATFITKMTTLAAGTSTSLNVDRLEYDTAIPESVFTPRFLETGRP